MMVWGICSAPQYCECKECLNIGNKMMHEMKQTIEVKYSDYEQKRDLIKWLNERNICFNIKNKISEKEYQDLMREIGE